MSTFIGNIEVRMDEKGRIFVPSVYRKILAEQESKRLVMRRDTDNECLIFYPEQVWNEKVSDLRDALDDWDPQDQLLLMQFMSEAEFLDMDNQGRVLLQKKNVEVLSGEAADEGQKRSGAAGSQEFVFVGMFDRFALWDAKIFEAHKMAPSDLAATIRTKMRNRKNG